MEDVLDPIRNVDPAFFATLLALRDGRVVSGRVRGEEGANLVLVDRNGKETPVPSAEVEERRPTRLSPMPSDFGSVLAEADLYDLVAYLLAEAGESVAPVSWRVVPIDGRFRSEGVSVADVNRDGRPDILAGEVWYEAPDWTMHEIVEPRDHGDGSGSLSRCSSCYADDVNGDGWPDAIVIGMPGEPCRWYENPKGEARHWSPHPISTSACNETPLHVDLFGNGRRVLVMGIQPEGAQESGRMVWLEPAGDPSKPWVAHCSWRTSTGTA